MERSTISRSATVLATVVAVVTLLLVAVVTPAGSNEVGSSQKISETAGGFGGDLDPVDLWGHGLAVLGDLDGDGVQDLAAGAFGDGDGGGNTGALWVLFMNSDGTVKAEQKISDTQGGFAGNLADNAVFGASMGTAGDLNGDGRLELAVGNYGDDDGGDNRGAVWILFLNSDGTVSSHQKISDTQGGFSGILSDGNQFGHSVVSIGDLDGNDVPDLAVGSAFDDDGGSDRGAVWILFMNSDGTVSSEQKISATRGGFAGSLSDNDQFGRSVAKIGDLDGDGNTEVAVGANGDTDGGAEAGAVWVLFMNADGTVKSEQKISQLAGGLTGPIVADDWFGWAVGETADLDSDGIPDLAVGARQDDDGGARRGAIWVLLLNSNGTVKSEQKISSLAGGFGGGLDNGDEFGSAVVGIEDLDGDGDVDLATGAIGDDDGGSQQGAVWILFLAGTTNQPPVVDAGGPYGGDEGAAIALSGATASDPESGPLTLSWTVDAPAVCSFTDAAALNPDLTCDDGGTYTVTLTADDGTAAPVTDNAAVTVAVAKPETVGLHDPATGHWDLRNSVGAVTRITYGDPDDQPFMGDWDCDGIDTPGLYRRVNTASGPAGKVYLRSSNTTGVADIEYFFGNPDDIAIPGDFDGDGCDTVALFRPHPAATNRQTNAGSGIQGTMFITNRLGTNNQGIGAAEFSFPFGDIDFPPFAGNFDTDPADELGYYVPDSAGESLNVFLHFGLSNGTPDLDFLYGNPGDIGLAADWNADGLDTIAVYRPAEFFGPAAATFYLRNSNTTGIGDTTISPFGDASWTPLHGHFGLDE